MILSRCFVCGCVRVESRHSPFHVVSKGNSKSDCFERWHRFKIDTERQTIERASEFASNDEIIMERKVDLMRLRGQRLSRLGACLDPSPKLSV